MRVKDSSLLCLQGEGEEDETDELVSQVLDEIGVDLDTNLVSAPMRGKAKQQEAAPEAAGQQAEPMGQSAGGGDAGSSGIDDDLQARLNNLRKP